MIVLVGIDCATDPRKTGLALGEIEGGGVRILRATTGTANVEPAAIVADWLQPHDQALIAFDAPLGWPSALGDSLVGHFAGNPIPISPDILFRRKTDEEIFRRFGKRPLEVGANLIARTAHSALNLLGEIRRRTRMEIPLAWSPKEASPFRAIEVYPAATRLAHGAPDRRGSLEGLADVLDSSAVQATLQTSEHAADAAVCVLAAADFLLGRACPPTDLTVVMREGWIWAPAPRFNQPLETRSHCPL